MPTLRFEGSSDDTFGETLCTGEDFDNCASGEPIVFLIEHGDDAVLVVGQYAPKGLECSWLVSIATFDPKNDDRPLPSWPMHIERGSAPYSPALVIEAPHGFKLRCLTAEANER